MANEQWNEGDLVQLKSGGPIMTVEKTFQVEGQNRVRCLWFENQKKHADAFSPATLQAYTEPSLD